VPFANSALRAPLRTRREGPDIYTQRAGTRARLLQQQNGGLRRTSCRVSLVVPRVTYLTKPVGLSDFKLAVLPGRRKEKVLTADNAARDDPQNMPYRMQKLSPTPTTRYPAAEHTPRQLALHDFVARQVLPSIAIAKNRRPQQRLSIDPVDFSNVLGNDAELRWKLTRLHWTT